MYSTVPRRFASVNTMVAHEHFMLRLPALDEALSSLLERLEATTLQDTVLFLLSDHGTHGIW
jgi:arylsulfatase A-like enzyme